MSEAITEAASPPEISFEITPQDSIDAAAYAHARAVGSLRFMSWLPVGGALAGLALGLALAPSLNAAMFLINPAIAIVFMSLPTGITVALAIVGYALGSRFAAKTYHRRYLFGMYERGMPARAAVTIRLTDAVFEAGNGRMTYSIGWPFIAEMVPTPIAWTVVADMTTFVVPKAAFADENAERHFVKEVLARISPSARERSTEARAFAEQPTAP